MYLTQGVKTEISILYTETEYNVFNVHFENLVVHRYNNYFLLTKGEGVSLMFSARGQLVNSQTSKTVFN